MEKVLVFADMSELSYQAAQICFAAIQDDCAAGREPAVILAGGSTPQACYRRLAELLREFPDGRQRVRWLVGDERWVDRGHKDSNEGMIRASLLTPLEIAEQQIFSWQAGSGSPIGRARQYEELLKAHFDAQSRYPDLLVLGLGEDGHTASLFADGWAMRGGAPDPTRDAMPMSPNLPGWTAAVYAPRVQSFRLTLTPGFLRLARRIYFLVSGESKRDVLTRVLNRDLDLPASWLNLEHTRFLATRDAVSADRI